MIVSNNGKHNGLVSNSDQERLMHTLREVDQQASLLESVLPSTKSIARIDENGRFQSMVDSSNSGRSR